MTISKLMVSTAAGAALMLGAVAPGMAQENTEPAMPEAMPEMSAPTTDFSDAQIESFAVAFVEVNEIGMSFEQEAQAAQSDEELMNLQVQAQEEMAAAVESTDGISVDDYNMILTAAQSDPEFGAQIQAEVDALLQ
ncbi:DUF4168 domain-containing protein [Pelagibacterium montanilacus]|uniref:DUF4168 domain-containing protein n=1 Tax=Pelagibacterium montanilacus TaxID=2185280 RepID=UPI000F8E974F|nr:DUF4168 domain-containing protein [Pelagibacterium montanilacus]